MLSILRGILISAAFVLACWWSLQGSTSFQTCVQQNDKQSADTQSEKYAAAFVTRANVYRDCLGEFIHDRREEILTAFTVILALSTIFLWVATRDLVRSAEKTAKSELRAYISIEHGDIQFVDGGSTIQAQIQIKNFGQTPARNTVTWAAVRVLDAGHNIFDMTKSGRPTPGAMMGPGAVTLIQRFAAVSADDVAAIGVGAKRIFVWGRTEYIDAFGKKRWFEFRHRSTASPQASMQWGIEPYGKGEQGN